MGKSNLDLINECDAFPYYHDNPADYQKYIANYHAFKISGYNETFGLVLNSIVEKFPWPKEHWDVDSESRTVTLLVPKGATEAERSAVLAQTLETAAKSGNFEVLKGWRNELYPIYGPQKELVASVERAGSSLFGILSYGVHMTAYTKDPEKGIQIWVPRRSRTKQTYPGMLDNTVGGGIATGEEPFESLVREAMEEASLPEDIVRRDAKSCGCITYTYVRDERAGGETGLLQPECEYVYDLPLDPSVVLKPCDTEVEEFQLWSIEQVKEALSNGEFKPNCALVLIDFFIRHGFLTPENERDYLEILARIHRRHEFPTA
ncbi:thiamine pyrophosphokinase [Arthroderma uncinatum]|uniref:thiamine pyrophosphokinase n=1 Tax=Arthroderma uncinatum TaxID=74035 RepID=UPI00144AAFB4|nr:thiamine pyrophosphokinase [Arthroderma uncinatum]KAF3483094.1 thiamine pyrophosphokinase [Arthroderma uncinatum]